MDFEIKLRIIFDLSDREERMEELRKLIERYKEHEQVLRELVETKLKSLWKNEAIVQSKLRDLFESPPKTGEASVTEQFADLPVSHMF